MTNCKTIFVLPHMSAYYTNIFVLQTGRTWVCIPTLSCFKLFQPCWCCQWFPEQITPNRGKCFHTKDECHETCK